MKIPELIITKPSRINIDTFEDFYRAIQQVVTKCYEEFYGTVLKEDKLEIIVHKIQHSLQLIFKQAKEENRLPEDYIERIPVLNDRWNLTIDILLEEIEFLYNNPSKWDNDYEKEKAPNPVSNECIEDAQEDSTVIMPGRFSL